MTVASPLLRQGCTSAPNLRANIRQFKRQYLPHLVAVQTFANTNLANMDNLGPGRIWFFQFLALNLFLPLCYSLSAYELYNYGISVDQSLSKEHDVSSIEIPLSVPIVHYENTYSSIFVNDNGLLSFIAEVSLFLNNEFQHMSYPMIAPMYSRVDTRGHGMVYYRETNETELLNRASNDIVRHFSDGKEFRAKSLFIATWFQVGRFDQQTDLQNTVQVVIASNGTESYCFFLYPENGIQWLHSQGVLNNLVDAYTQAGFMSVDGRFYKLPGSGTEQVKNYPRMSNVNRKGLFMFHFGNTGTGNVILPDRDYENTLELQGVETCTNTNFPCLQTATCMEYNTGICCECQNDYFGNGRSCIRKDENIHVNGQINGIVNDIKIPNKIIYSYVQIQNGTVYTGIHEIDAKLGYDFQTPLLALGHIIGWMFAVSTQNAPNGFTLTGGVFNRTVDISFPQTGHKVIIFEQYLGLNVYNILNLKVDIKGTLPTIPSDSEVRIDDYQLEFTKVSHGTLKSRSTHSFNFGENSMDMPIILDQTITFDECPHRHVDNKLHATRLLVERNHIQYDINFKTPRYAFYNSRISFLSDNNPCDGIQCGDNSACIVVGDAFRCICNRGFEQYPHDSNIQRPICTDIDECRMGSNTCHRYAACTNEPGSYKCQCGDGFIGDGHHCESVENECNNIECNQNAQCIQTTNLGPRCVCKDGFYGDGFKCQEIQNDVEDCRSINLCDFNANCKLNRLMGLYTCVCNAGFRGNGIVCTEESESCDKLNNCGANAQCILSDNIEQPNNKYCACNQGFVGDGYTCIAEINADDCSILNNCHRHASCVVNEELNEYQCQCNDGFTGDGFKCYNSSYINICNGHEDCSPNADCIGDSITRRNVCRCRTGFVGNGLKCTPNSECIPDQNMCDPNALCRFNPLTKGYECQCNSGYNGDGITCSLNEIVRCNLVNDCDQNATCEVDPHTLKYFCKCNPGFSGDGKSCQINLSCDQLNNCDVKAECIYDESIGASKCQCTAGFVGDGYKCRPRESCRENHSICDRNAECLYKENIKDFICHCHYGFIGDGYQCSPMPAHEGDYMIFSQGMSILRMPLEDGPNVRPGYPLLTKSNQIPVGLDFDCLSGYIYWGDVASGKIFKAPYNGSMTEPLLQDITKAPEGVAIDWVSRNIYWTDSFKKTIEVANLDGSLHKVLIEDKLIKPRGIAVHPGSGKLYWSDWNRESPKIEYSNLDGKHRSVLVTNDLKLPNNLAIDFKHNDLCWTDAGLKRIECINLFTKSRRVIYSQATYPFDIAIVNNNIYWSDWDTKSIHQIDRNGGLSKRLEIPLGGHGRLYGLVAVPKYCPRISNACSVNNGGCKHLCLPNDRGRTCACPDNAYDEDETCNEI